MSARADVRGGGWVGRILRDVQREPVDRVHDELLALLVGAVVRDREPALAVDADLPPGRNGVRATTCAPSSAAVPAGNGGASRAVTTFRTITSRRIPSVAVTITIGTGESVP